MLYYKIDLSNMINTNMGYKIVIVGDVKVGKTTFVNLLKKRGFTTQYNATMGVDVSSHDINISNGNAIQVMLWDCAGNSALGGLRDGYYSHADAAIIMFDLCDRTTLCTIPNWYNSITRSINNDKVFFIGNKVDSNTTITSSDISNMGIRMSKYLEFSCKSCVQPKHVFQMIFRHLLNDHNLRVC